MRTHTIAASALLLLTLTGCSTPALPTPPSPAPSVTWSAPPSLTMALGPDATETLAWEIFDHGGGASQLRVNPARPFKVEFMAATLEYPSWADANDAVIPSKDGRWFWFHATYTD